MLHKSRAKHDNHQSSWKLRSPILALIWADKILNLQGLLCGGLPKRLDYENSTHVAVSKGTEDDRRLLGFGDHSMFRPNDTCIIGDGY